MIRLGTAADAPALAVLERAVFGADAWSTAQVEAELAGPTRHVVVAETDDVVIGYGAISVAGEVADLTRIVVVESERRSGVASELLICLHEAARQAGAERILLEVAERNSGALGFYARHGYSEISRRRGYYADGGDALVLAHRLG